MKTAISIPNKLFNEAEQIMHQLHLSRSALYTRALTDFVRTHHPHVITEALNAIYQNESSTLDAVLLNAQANSFSQEDW